jgi:hypothetical protein
MRIKKRFWKDEDPYPSEGGMYFEESALIVNVDGYDFAVARVGREFNPDSPYTVSWNIHEIFGNQDAVTYETTHFDKVPYQTKREAQRAVGKILKAAFNT